MDPMLTEENPLKISFFHKKLMLSIFCQPLYCCRVWIGPFTLFMNRTDKTVKSLTNIVVHIYTD